jgi:hypothetical protein
MRRRSARDSFAVHRAHGTVDVERRNNGIDSGVALNVTLRPDEAITISPCAPLTAPESGWCPDCGGNSGAASGHSMT